MPQFRVGEPAAAPGEPVVITRALRLEPALNQAVIALARASSLSLNTTMQGLLHMALDLACTPEGRGMFQATVAGYANRQAHTYTSRAGSRSQGMP